MSIDILIICFSNILAFDSFVRRYFRTKIQTIFSCTSIHYRLQRGIQKTNEDIVNGLGHWSIYGEGVQGFNHLPVNKMCVELLLLIIGILSKIPTQDFYNPLPQKNEILKQPLHYITLIFVKLYNNKILLCDPFAVLS